MAKMTKLEKAQKYFSRHGAKLERKKDASGKVRYHLTATRKFGHIKKGQEMCDTATLGPFENMAKNRFLG